CSPHSKRASTPAGRTPHFAMLPLRDICPSCGFPVRGACGSRNAILTARSRRGKSCEVDSAFTRSFIVELMGEVKRRGRIWWIRYYRDGRRFEESSESERYTDAVDLLKSREGEIVRGVPVSPKITRYRFEDAAADIEAEYIANGRRSLAHLQRRIRKHLKP